jgi:hypothetical protein
VETTLLGFQATFPRDTIYSILALAKDFPGLEEKWQDLHTEQLEVVRDKKVSFIDIELQAMRRKKNSSDEAREMHKPLEEEVRKLQKAIEKKNQEKQEARVSGKRDEERRIDEELRQMQVQEVEYADEALQTLDNGILQINLRIKQLEALRLRTEKEVETQPIGILPNYRFSPRDLFIAFVTRSIHESKSLDIICRHWAPRLNDDEGGDTLPSWISNLSKSPFGVPGTAQGRQNGENFVAYLPHDGRRRYSASGSDPANITMALDPTLDFQDARNLLEIKVPEIPVPTTKLSLARHQLGLSMAPDSLLSAPLASDAGKKPPGTADGEQSAAEPEFNPLPTSDDAQTRSRPARRQSPNMEGAARGQTSRGGSRRLSPSPRAPSENRHAKARNLKGSGTNNGQKKQPARKYEKMFGSPEARQQHRLSGILCVEGFILGEIVDQSEVMKGGIVPGEWVAKLGWDKDVQSENRVPDTLWRLLVADRMEKGGKPPQWYKRACLHGLVDDKVSDNQGNIHPVTYSNRRISELTSRYFRRVESVVWNRRVFELKLDKKFHDSSGPERSRNEEGNKGIGKGKPNGAAGEKTPEAQPEEDQRDGESSEEEDLETKKKVIGRDEQESPDPVYGLAPQGSKVSDIVCILLGCSVPVVLSRGSGENRSLYKVVGEAYVHGMMDGEAMEIMPVKEMNGESVLDSTIFKLI